MELAFGLFIIIIAFGLVFSNGGISKENLIQISKALEEDLKREFKKRDKKIETLEKQIEELKKGK